MHPLGTPGQPAGLPQIGQILGGKYEIVRLLGEGGMAFVFEASHQRLHQRVAIKLLTPEFARDPELVARFEREARAVAQLRTKHVARVMDVDATAEGIPYIVMEFLEGRDLDAELQARTRLPLGEAVDIILQACAGMVEAHGIGIVHRDLKPANLFLTTQHEGTDRFVKVLDFGISKVVGEATRLTGAGTVIGTVLYMSPEQVRAQANVDTRADIWSLGVILYELLAGRAPWEGHSHQIAAAIVSHDPPDLRSFVAVPDAVANAVLAMLKRDPAHRFATVQELIAALAPFAPFGSIGAGVAEQVSLGQSGSRARASMHMAKYTLPMTSRPAVLEAISAAARASHGPQPGTPTAIAPPPVSLAPLSAGGRSRARLVLIFAIAIGLLGAAGVVLILVATLHRAAPPPAVAEDAAAFAPASGRTASPTASPSPSSNGGAFNAEPPSTGTTGRAVNPGASTTARGGSPIAPVTPTPAPSTSGAARKDGGAGHPATPSSSSGGPPAFL